MFLDRDLLRAWGSRVSHAAGVDILVAAWRGLSPGERADRLAANGDVIAAAATGAPGWASLRDGDVVEALRVAREGHGGGRRPVTLLEAEALVAAGAIVEGLSLLRQLSDAGSVPATVALARRQHALGDHRGAVRSGVRVPMQAQAAQVTARALLALHADAEALRRIEPFFEGGAPVPDAMSAGAFAVLGAGALARLGQRTRLRRFAETLLDAPDAPPETAPTVARAAWTGGLAGPAWNRFADVQDPWAVAGRLELAALAGDVGLIRGLIARAGPLGTPAQDALALIEGPAVPSGDGFDEDGTYHVWRTHPSRWQPWIDAVSRGPGRVEVYDLAAGRLPDRQAIPALALDDGALVSMVAPVPVPVRPMSGKGVFIDRQLCVGVGIGHDWPEEEHRALMAAVMPASPAEAAVWVTGADRALAHAHEGRRTVVLAPPGDPFWAGPLPQRAWPAFRVVRASPQGGWAGAGERVAQAVRELLEAAAGDSVSDPGVASGDAGPSGEDASAPARDSTAAPEDFGAEGGDSSPSRDDADESPVDVAADSVAEPSARGSARGRPSLEEPSARGSARGRPSLEVPGVVDAPGEDAGVPAETATPDDTDTVLPEDSGATRDDADAPVEDSAAAPDASERSPGDAGANDPGGENG